MVVGVVCSGGGAADVHRRIRSVRLCVLVHV